MGPVGEVCDLLGKADQLQCHGIENGREGKNPHDQCHSQAEGEREVSQPQVGVSVADQGGCRTHHHDDGGFYEECEGEGNSIGSQIEPGLGEPGHNGSQKRAFSRHHEPGNCQQAPQAENGALRQHRRYSDSRRRSSSSLIRSSAPGLSVAPMSSMD